MQIVGSLACRWLSHLVTTVTSCYPFYQQTSKTLSQFTVTWLLEVSTKHELYKTMLGETCVNHIFY